MGIFIDKDKQISLKLKVRADELQQSGAPASEYLCLREEALRHMKLYAARQPRRLTQKEINDANLMYLLMNGP